MRVKHLLLQLLLQLAAAGALSCSTSPPLSLAYPHASAFVTFLPQPLGASAFYCLKQPSSPQMLRSPAAEALSSAHHFQKEPRLPSLQIPAFGRASSFRSSKHASECLATASAALQEPTDGKLKVVVVGGGPAGLSSASWLLSTNLVSEVAVVEREPEGNMGRLTSTSWGIGIGRRCQAEMTRISPNVLDVLKQSGSVFDLPSGLLIFSQQQKIRTALYRDLKERYPPDAAGDEVLHFHFSDWASEIDVNRKTIRLQGGKTLKYDLLVIADGVSSQTRSMLENDKMQVVKTTLPMAFKGFVAPKSAFNSSFAFMTAYPSIQDPFTGPMGILTSQPESNFMSLSFHYKHQATQKLSTVEDLRKYLLSMKPVARMPSPLNNESWQHFVNSVPLQSMQECIDSDFKFTWASNAAEIVDQENGIAMVGDAAHAQPNLLGNGITSAVQDGRFLAEALTMVAEKAQEPIPKAEILRRALPSFSQVSQREVAAAQTLNKVSIWLRRSKWPFLSSIEKLLNSKISSPDGFAKIMQSKRLRFCAVLASRFWDSNTLTEEEVQALNDGVFSVEN